jgi:serine protease Do
MSLDRRSFRFGILAGISVVVAVVAAFVYLPQRFSSTANDVQAATTPPAATTSVGLPNEGFTAVVKESMPAVVNISTTRVVKSQGAAPFMNDPFFKEFFGDEFSRQFQVPKSRRESALGSGVIVDKRGYIITNNHVIAKADEIKVVLNDKREFKAKLIGTDPKTDVAVIKIKGDNLPVLPWGNSDNLQVGEYVLAIGNPFGLSQTVTMGIVSATGRANVGIADYEDFIQTDAAINPGNSGGALVNAKGQLVGMNTAIFSRSGGYMGIGFAVPSNMAHKVMESLIKNGKVTRGWLGVSIQALDEELAKHFGLKSPEGVLVNEVMDGTPAAKGGVKEGDVIVAFDGKKTPDPTTLRNIVAETKVGKRVKMTVMRDGKAKTLNIMVAEQPKNLTMSQQQQPESDHNTSSILKGVEVQNMNPQIAQQLGLPKTTTGVVVTDVSVGSPAERAGLISGDVILQVNNKRITNIGDFRNAVQSANKKRGLLLLINRHGRKEFLGIEP